MLNYLQARPDGDVFEVFFGTKQIGLVWRSGEVWHADPESMASPFIEERDREAAAEALLEVVDLRVDGQPEEKAVRDPSPE